MTFVKSFKSFGQKMSKKSYKKELTDSM